MRTAQKLDAAGGCGTISRIIVTKAIQRIVKKKKLKNSYFRLFICKLIIYLVPDTLGIEFSNHGLSIPGVGTNTEGLGSITESFPLQ